MNNQIEKSFNEHVELKYQLYNSLFLTLPLDAVEQTGILIPLLHEACRNGLEHNLDPSKIIRDFFAAHRPGLTERQQITFLFKVIQYVERQIVLIDALEDSAYTSIYNTAGPDSWNQFALRATTEDRDEELEKLLHQSGIRVVLTAHPTQFYPSQVLAIINDLTIAIGNDDAPLVRDLLQQLGKTPFFRKEKPSPYDEADRLTWYLGHVFYPAVGNLLDRISEDYADAVDANGGLIQLGFWPGGDRDGNPFVTPDITLKVARRLRYAITTGYYLDMKNLKRRLSFVGVYERLDRLESLLYDELTHADGSHNVDLAQFEKELQETADMVAKEHDGFFLERLQSLRRKVQTFGFHFASIDIRQDSRVIGGVFEEIRKAEPTLLPDLSGLSSAEQLKTLMALEGEVSPNDFEDPLTVDTLSSPGVIKSIQSMNGEAGAHRYIISNCRSEVDMARVFALFRLCGWPEELLTVDIVPLFETVADLGHADGSMRAMYQNARYRAHLKRRDNRQTVMLGFSDGTKDGGYLMANWAIYKAKETITKVSREFGIEVIFFDGRGGPPARGGGNTHLFYAALGDSIEKNRIQLTVQGQTISSHYGIVESAMHNLGHLLTAGLSSRLFRPRDAELSEDQRKLMQALADASYRKYEAFKKDPLFVPYLEERSPLKYYGMTNIGSRPAKRGHDSRLTLDDLRAIPFVGAWSQLKQNIPGFFGIGTALREQEEAGNLDDCIELYAKSAFFRALISNSMQSMSKTNFALTRYMRKDPKFGKFWQLIFDEFELSRDMVLKISGQTRLLEDNPRSRLSIKLRESIVLPLLIIQQYALVRLQTDTELGELYDKIVIRSLFGNINASRNSA